MKKILLPPQQLKLYRAIKNNPLISYPQLMKILGVRSRAGVRTAILALARKGYVAPNKEKAWLVLK